jgi:hypothetical protein
MHDALNDLFDHASELADAAAALKRDAARAGAEEAAAAVAGCLEAALRDLADVSAALGSSTPDPDDERSLVRVVRMQHGFGNLTVALHDAARAADDARIRAARALAPGR